MHTVAAVLTRDPALVVAAIVVATAIAGTLLARSRHHAFGLPIALAGYAAGAAAVTMLVDPVTAAAIDVALVYVAFCHGLALVHFDHEYAVGDPEQAAIARARRILAGR